MTQLLNPKVPLFFAALLPQFVVSKAAHSPRPFLFLGKVFVGMDTIWSLLLTAFSALFTAGLRRSARVQIVLKRLTGLLYIGLGLNMLWLRARLAS